MEITSKWIEGNKFEVNNGRHPAVTLDTPAKFGGKDSAPSALELAIMALAGCLGTTYKMTAQHMHLEVTALEVKANFTKRDDMYLNDVSLIVYATSKSDEQKLLKCLELAEKNCPVDVLFHQTKIPIKTQLKIIS